MVVEEKPQKNVNSFEVFRFIKSLSKPKTISLYFKKNTKMKTKIVVVGLGGVGGYYGGLLAKQYENHSDIEIYFVARGAHLQKIKENFQQFAIQKFSSNVVEKCVERAPSVRLFKIKL